MTTVLARCIARLPPPLRDVFLLVEVLRREPSTVAATLGVSARLLEARRVLSRAVVEELIRQADELS